jgi:hypothetical protein
VEYILVTVIAINENKKSVKGNFEKEVSVELKWGGKEYD